MQGDRRLFHTFPQRCKNYTSEEVASNVPSQDSFSINNDISSDLITLHYQFIKDLYKDRNAPVVPFDLNLVIASCLNFTDNILKDKFLKEWGSQGGIYLIEYKYYPNIYYVGRTNSFKKRLYEHFKSESHSKFHLFIRLIGPEHFNVHIIEVCPVPKQGERETYYLQKYIPLLNSVFSSSITEGEIQQTLLLKLKALRAINKVKDPKLHLFMFTTEQKKELVKKLLSIRVVMRQVEL